MQCPKCNRKNPMKNAFCVHCGEDLRDGAEESQGNPRYQRSGHDGPPMPTHRADSLDYGANAVSLAKSVKKRFESPEELGHGQVVVVAARWILVGAGLLLALWNPDAMGELRVQIMLIVGLAVGNFFLHSQILMKRPVAAAIAYGASAADIAVISLIVIAAGGLESGLYVFYFPALLALSVAFRTEVTYTFAGAAIAAYGLIASVSLAGGDEGAVLITRMLMLAAVAVCGNIYWRTERDRRRAATETRDELLKEVRQEVTAQ